MHSMQPDGLERIVSLTLLSLHDQTVQLACPRSVESDIEFLYRDSIANSGVPSSRILIEEEDGLFSVAADGAAPVAGLARRDLRIFVMEAVVRGLVKDLTTAVALHAGCVAHSGKAALIAGPTGAGKSSLVAWLIANGFTYLSDEIALLLPGQSAIFGLPRALVLKPGSVEEVLALPAYQDARFLTAGEHVMLRPGFVRPQEAKTYPCGLIVFPRYEAGSELRVEAISPAQTALRLVGTNLNARNLADGGFRALTGFARQVPSVTLRYGGFGQLQGAVDVLARFLLDGNAEAAARRRFLSLFGPAPPPAEAIVAPSAAPLSPKKSEIPTPTPRREPRRLTIGMATYDDYDGVYFSLQAIRLYHPQILDETNFLVVDNHPDGPCAKSLKALEGSTPHYRYVPFNSHSGTAVRDCLFAEADGEFVLCMDCHVFIVPGALKHLMDYLAAHPETPDLLQGPLVFDDLVTIATHFHPVWRAGMYGYWETDERGKNPDAPPFDIPMQGLGVFGCRRAVWPGFNPRFRGFGGEEGYIHEKFRRKGGRTLCLPFLRWMHRFSRPMGVPYTNRWEDRVRNYMIGFRELSLPTAEVEQHFQELLGETAGPMLQRIKQELDGASG
jgi:glycosyl transferase family 2